jgi:hydrogenase maturation factor HypF (carbamoyltransferase family)
VKLIVCEECEAEFKIAHSMDEHHYQITSCPFCGETVNDPEYIHEVSWDEDD